MNFKHKTTSYMLYNLLNKFKGYIVLLTFFKVRVKYFDLRDFSMSFQKKIMAIFQQQKIRKLFQLWHENGTKFLNIMKPWLVIMLKIKDC